MTTQEGKHPVYRLQGAGDEQEGVEIPMRLKDINGDPIETAGGGSKRLVLAGVNNDGTNPPTYTVVVDDFSGEWTFNYEAEGRFSILPTNAGTFPVAKTILMFQAGSNTEGAMTSFYLNAEDIIFLRFFDFDDNYNTDLLENGSLVIEVYS